MNRAPKSSKSQQFNRIALVARVEIAYEAVAEAMERLRSGAPNARQAVVAARQRFNLLNRALAMMALNTSAIAA